MASIEAVGLHGNLRASATIANASSSWPTVYGQGAGNSGPDGNEFSTMVRNWQTPNAQDPNKGDYTRDGGDPASPRASLSGEAKEVSAWQTPAVDSFRSRGGDRVDEMGLDQQARNWPSPRSEDSESCGNHPEVQDSLTGFTKAWPTPSASNVNDGESLESWETRRQLNLLKHINGNGQGTPLAIAVKMWPTPTEDNVNNNGGPSRTKGMEEGGYLDLTVAVKQWPTPNANPAPRGENFTKSDGHYKPHDLATSTQNWPTAGANDHKGSSAEGQRHGQLDEAAEQIYSRPARETRDGQTFSENSSGSRQRLNPAFVCWLMGFPWWWTNPVRISFARSVMELWLNAQRLHLRFLLGE